MQTATRKETYMGKAGKRGGDTSLTSGLSVAFVATCPPRQCGIATFAKDLEQALKAADSGLTIPWAAINETMSIHPYGPEVRWRIRQGDAESYQQAAHHLDEATGELRMCYGAADTSVALATARVSDLRDWLRTQPTSPLFEKRPGYYDDWRSRLSGGRRRSKCA